MLFHITIPLDYPWIIPLTKPLSDHLNIDRIKDDVLNHRMTPVRPPSSITSSVL